MLLTPRKLEISDINGAFKSAVTVLIKNRFAYIAIILASVLLSILVNTNSPLSALALPLLIIGLHLSMVVCQLTDFNKNQPINQTIKEIFISVFWLQRYTIVFFIIFSFASADTNRNTKFCNL